MIQLHCRAGSQVSLPPWHDAVILGKCQKQKRLCVMSGKCKEELISEVLAVTQMRRSKKPIPNLNELTDKLPRNPVYLLKRTKYAW